MGQWYQSYNSLRNSLKGCAFFFPDDLNIDLAGYSIPSLEAFGTPLVELSADLITADSDSITADANDVTADGSWGGALPTDTLYPAGIASSEAFGLPVLVDEYNQQVYPTGIPSGEALGTPILTLNVVTADNGVITADSYRVTADGGISNYITAGSATVRASSGVITIDTLYEGGTPPEYLIDTDTGEYLIDTDSQDYLEGV